MSRDMVSTGPTLASPDPFGDFLDREHLVPGGAKIDVAQFSATDAVVVVVGAAGAAGGATSVPVDALSGPIPSGVTLHFGTNKFATLSAAAAAAATSLTVLAIPTALVDNDSATYSGVGLRSVPKATPVGRTIAERDASTGFGPALSTDDEIFLTAFDIPDAGAVGYSGDVDLARHGTIVRENWVPGWTASLLALKTAIRARYACTRGAE